MASVTSRVPDRARLFAELAVVVAITTFVGALAYAFASDAADADALPAPASTGAAAVDGDGTPVTMDGGIDLDGIDLDDRVAADPDADPTDVFAAAAEAMGAVTSVEFRLERDGAPVFIDQFESLALDGLIGQFTVPGRAQAQLRITVDDDLATEIGAIAVGEEIWISNPVTGDFETLPDGIDIDPSQFFDPDDGWRPLLSGLRDVELVGIVDRDGERYHLRGIAPASEVENITVGLVEDQDITIDVWVHPGTSLVTHVEFETNLGNGTSQWSLEMARYGASFTIRPPANVRETSGS